MCYKERERDANMILVSFMWFYRYVGTLTGKRLPWPLFCLFLFFFRKKTVGFRGIQTQIVGVAGEHADPLTTDHCRDCCSLVTALNWQDEQRNVKCKHILSIIWYHKNVRGLGKYPNLYGDCFCLSNILHFQRQILVRCLAIILRPNEP